MGWKRQSGAARYDGKGYSSIVEVRKDKTFSGLKVACQPIDRLNRDHHVSWVGTILTTSRTAFQMNAKSMKATKLNHDHHFKTFR